MKSIKLLIKKIEKIVNPLKLKNIDKKKFILETLILNMNLEKIIFSKSKINPKISTIKILNKFLKLQSARFKKKEKKFEKVYNNEAQHKFIFQQLWSSYNLAEYKKFRIDRYLRRIRINNLRKIIKNKKCIDYGCGHGNFLVACYKNGAKECLGLDYGKKNIVYANTMVKKLRLDKKKIKFKTRNVYRTNVPENSFDFAIQNGVYHHLDNEEKAYKEVARVLKKSGFFWVYTDGGGGIRDLVTDMSQKILRPIKRSLIFQVILSKNLGVNKSYHFSDNLTAKYRHHTFKSITQKLKKCGFKNFKQLKGGYTTDFDKPFTKIKYFKERFGSGDLRILCQKK